MIDYVRLVPGQWTVLPGTRLAVCAVHAGDVVVRRWDGVWDLSRANVLLLVRKVDGDGRPLTWPWPITPLPLRAATEAVRA